MINFGNNPSIDEANRWRSALDEFVAENEQALAALAWGLLQEWGDSQDALGIDLKPTPHFVRCSRAAIERLNRQVNRKIQEILGVLDGYDPEAEVVAIAIGEGQLKLIYFQPEPSPPVCFEQIEGDLDTLIQQLEERMRDKF
ncbi:MAG: hypothetical protein IGR93_10825 [Hydrococcus sp. C42_A2020_068]|uniref:beta-carboxysome assembly chaperone CcmS n=1 Tax=Pleurocapsa sp. PCC 7327 TaxID=118163 RepID=UPI00029F8F9C|nr:hypothetical protein [Pleurocapsa sp. PCC 7327]AFY78869.1 hypothetical protein Ple7327_3679 [Pleurocapsa sp. PCC 7327]MBF2020576.1 hypothetical protein [Hydrococcus sp. C42_A2020_068]